ncbi:type II toxin-antitoxin system MqsR family toxin [Pseudomonas paralcaligenes]|uniref:type II toxin-antitoxin system MqsR family toxin n=1 Tax=Pseudomonas paralcaligenes TaxID=2772558 RepID=UPI001C7F3E88|nr:type II toxin-antitoxin system MqsR family toxin [Pseudomonas paralcaligenes]
MEKRTPHFKLSLVKAAIAAESYRFTRVAREGGADLGLDLDGMLAIIQALTARDFYKSMTTYADHTQWQDVYRPATRVGRVYLKFTLVEDLLIVSFKEL